MEESRRGPRQPNKKQQSFSWIGGPNMQCKIKCWLLQLRLIVVRDEWNVSKNSFQFPFVFSSAARMGIVVTCYASSQTSVLFRGNCRTYVHSSTFPFKCVRDVARNLLYLFCKRFSRILPNAFLVTNLFSIPYPTDAIQYF